MSDEDKLSAMAVAFGLESGANGRRFSHLEVHGRMYRLLDERLEPSAVWRWLLASGKFVYNPDTHYLTVS